MLPYWDEYVSTNEKNIVYIKRLTKLQEHQKNVLEMSAEDLYTILKMDNKRKTTIDCDISTLRCYLQWIKEVHNIPISNIYYEVDKLVKMKREAESTPKFFENFEELKTVLIEAEDNYLRIAEDEMTETQYDTICLKQKMNRAYITLLWLQWTDKEMLHFGLQDAVKVLTSKEIMSCGKLVKLSNIQLDFIQDGLDAVLYIRDNENKSLYRVNADNYFNTDSEKSLSNLTFLALNKKNELRLLKANIKTSGQFFKIHDYEIKNDHYFANSTSEANIICDLLNISSKITAHKILSEYSKWRKDLAKHAVN